MLKIENLSVQVAGKTVLKGLNLQLTTGQIHVLMGPNGAGKSTLASVLAGRDGYDVIQGSITLDGRDLLSLSAEDRATAGLFVSFQNPVEIPGVSFINFLKAAVVAQCQSRGQEVPSSGEILNLVKAKLAFLGLPADFYKKEVNAGLSGGQKKLGELLQLAVLQPRLAVLDEIDSGLDVDAIKLVANGLDRLRTNERAFLIITHYQKILRYITPDLVHILKNGQIVRTGGPDLLSVVEVDGYGGFN